MDELPTKKEIEVNKEQSTVGAVVFLTLYVVISGLLMYWTWNTVDSNDQTTDLSYFLLFWLREIIFGVLFIVGGFLVAIRFFRKMFMKDINEL
ncbi:hypothetical protein H8K33_00210 [Undibacterium amnicola]|uniref:Uncharacterized protein n=1 Tax=Undibacterium amnicola TaxID=1834038 RepID=A0ABR6XKY8_9BURK|nr:hypothetical protein [Undibacterium amnicola]